MSDVNDKTRKWKKISGNPNITWDIVTDNLHRPWDWSVLSKHKNITWEIIKNNPDKPWDLDNAMKNPNITWDMIFKIQDLEHDAPCDINSDVEEKNITWDLVKNNLDEIWDWGLLSKNKSVTWDIIKNNQHYSDGERIPWNFDFVSINPNITWEIVAENPHPLGMEWNWKMLPRNPNITREIIYNNSRPWDYKYIDTHQDIDYHAEQLVNEMKRDGHKLCRLSFYKLSSCGTYLLYHAKIYTTWYRSCHLQKHLRNLRNKYELPRWANNIVVQYHLLGGYNIQLG
jgi:hypothetical protein